MTRSLPLLAALAAAALPANAMARCPVSFLAAPASWGPPVATSSEGVRAYQPSGLSLLGRKVSYVYIDGEGEDVHFRLAGETLRTGQALSRTLRDAFQQAYPDGGCDPEGRGAFCEDYSMTAERVGGLTEAVMGDGMPSGNWIGAGAGPIQADARLGDGERAVYLTCSYRGDDE